MFCLDPVTVVVLIALYLGPRGGENQNLCLRYLYLLRDRAKWPSYLTTRSLSHCNLWIWNLLIWREIFRNIYIFILIFSRIFYIISLLKPQEIIGFKEEMYSTTYGGTYHSLIVSNRTLCLSLFTYSLLSFDQRNWTFKVTCIKYIAVL